MQKTKSIILGLVSLVLQVLSWWFLNIDINRQNTAQSWIWLALLAAAAISVTTFFFLTDRMRWYSETIIALSAVAYVIISDKNPYVWVGGLLFLAFTFWYEIRLHGEAVSRLDFSVTRVVGGSVSIMVYGLLLLLGFNIYSHVQTTFQANPDQFYDRVGTQAARSVPYFTKWLPDNTNLNQSFESYLEGQAQSDPNYSSATDSQKQALTQQAETAFENHFKITADPNQSLAQIIGDVAANKVREASAPFEKYLPLVFTIIIIGLLYSFGFLIRWVIILISWILFQILVATKFFKFETVVVEVKKLIV